MIKEAWDYVFLGKPYSEKIKIPEEKLKRMREEFLYWYPLDLRCSAKDLIKNHLIMSLYNHAAIWNDPKMMPRSFFCNGYILVDNNKMAKSLGNFLTVGDVVTRYGADAARFACAQGGDTLDDPNFTNKNADDAILKISTLEMWLKATMTPNQIKSMRCNEEAKDDRISFFDKIFENEMNNLV